MPIACPIDSLLSTETAPAVLRQILLDLTPEKIDQALLTVCVEKIASTALPEFKRFAKFADAVVDCCGTGGSGIAHFNTSTATAFVLAASGIPVAKIGNRSASGQSGSFDMLAQLGFKANLSAENAERLLHNEKLVFLYAAQVYPVLARLSTIRKALQTKTIFNFIGPLLNPCSPNFRLIGVSCKKMQRHIAEYLAGQRKTAMLVRAACGLDELCPSCQNQLLETFGSIPACYVSLRHYRQHQADSRACPAQEAEFADHSRNKMDDSERSKFNAKILLDIFATRDVQSTPYKLICLNAGAAMFMRGAAKSIEDGQQQATELLASGAVMEQFERTRSAYDKYAF